MKKITNKILVVFIIIALFIFIAYQMTESKKKQKEVEIERKLELVDWGDLRNSFVTRCVGVLNEIEGLQPFLSTKKLFTDEEVREFELDARDNPPLSVEYACEALGESDAIRKPFSDEFSRVERNYDPSDYEKSIDETRRLSN